MDTHVWAWSLYVEARLTAKAAALLSGQHNAFLSPISFFEIAQKVRIGKWPEMEARLSSLIETFRRQGGRIAALTPEICQRAASLDWSNRDPFDRIVAATALENNLSLVSADAAFDSLAIHEGWRKRIW